jgi:hypothetical protein
MDSSSSEHGMNTIQKFLLNRSIARNSAVYDSGRDENRAVQLLNWDAIVGTILVVGVGVSFWLGAGLMVARLWK